MVVVNDSSNNNNNNNKNTNFLVVVVVVAVVGVPVLLPRGLVLVALRVSAIMGVVVRLAA